MSIVINRKTKMILESVSTPDYLNNPDWLIIKCSPLGIDKKLPACDSKYWKIVNDDIVEMSEEEKKVRDQQEAQARQMAMERQENERKIMAELRKAVIEQLKKKGELPADYVDIS